ncbi:MAG: NUDIX hydrolase [Ruminococcus sp.]|nr:NUDIX hydrolase [Ruminococcus sp.]
MKRLTDDNGKTLEEFLAGYSPKDYPRPSVTADIVLLSKNDDKYSVLLIKRGGHPYLDHWALPGGFAEKNETIHETAKRELIEETSLDSILMEELGVFSTPSRDPRCWTMTDAFFAVVNADEVQPKAKDDAKDAQWFTIEISDSETQTKLTLKNNDETLNITLSKKVTAGVTKDIVGFKITENDGVAFDHGEIIASALERIGAINSKIS